MSHDEGLVCRCSTNHQPHPLELTKHHIWPQGMGGPDIPENLEPLDPTTHYNVHELLRIFLRENRVLTFTEVGDLYDVPVSRWAYKVAAEGYRRFHGMPWQTL